MNESRSVTVETLQREESPVSMAMLGTRRDWPKRRQQVTSVVFIRALDCHHQMWLFIRTAEGMETL